MSTCDGFWGERIDAVADRTADDPLRSLRRGRHVRPDRSGPSGAGDPHAVPHARRRHARHRQRADVLGFRRRQGDRDRGLCALSASPIPTSKRRSTRSSTMFARLQQPDGYVNSWFIRMQPGERWTNLRDYHELYCAGHLMEAAVAYFQATGKRNAARRDVPLCRPHRPHASGRGPGRSPAIAAMRRSSWRWCGSARATGERRYLDLAQLLRRASAGSQPHYFDVEARGARRRSDAVPPQDLRVQPVASCRCASRTRSSATRCARCISIPAWPTSRRSSATTA